MTPHDHLATARNEILEAIRLAQINANQLFYQQRLSPWKDRCLDIWRLEHALTLLDNPGAKNKIPSEG